MRQAATSASVSLCISAISSSVRSRNLIWSDGGQVREHPELLVQRFEPGDLFVIGSSRAR